MASKLLVGITALLSVLVVIAGWIELDDIVIVLITVPFVALQLVGVCLIYCLKQYKVGQIVYIIGAIPFVPMAIMGIYGVRMFLNKVEKDAFERRRAEQASQKQVEE